jgi:transposase
VRRLSTLVRETIECEARCEQLRDRRATAILKALEEEGVSRRVLADELGVSASAVQYWSRRGRQLAD